MRNPLEQVDNAAKMLEELMQPEDEARNEHKRIQLRELAALNGTLKVCTRPTGCLQNLTTHVAAPVDRHYMHATSNKAVGDEAQFFACLLGWGQQS